MKFILKYLRMAKDMLLIYENGELRVDGYFSLMLMIENLFWDIYSLSLVEK